MEEHYIAKYKSQLYLKDCLFQQRSAYELVLTPPPLHSENDGLISARTGGSGISSRHRRHPPGAAGGRVWELGDLTSAMAAGATVALGEHIRGHRFENASRTLTVEFGTHQRARSPTARHPMGLHATMIAQRGLAKLTRTAAPQATRSMRSSCCGRCAAFLAPPGATTNACTRRRGVLWWGRAAEPCRPAGEGGDEERRLCRGLR